MAVTAKPDLRERRRLATQAEIEDAALDLFERQGCERTTVLEIARAAGVSQSTFFRYFATYPYYSDAVWYLTQMRRWGQIPEDKPDSWYDEAAKQVYRPDIYTKAASLLIEEGLAQSSDFPSQTDGYRPATSDFIDGMEYDGREPNAYLAKFAIGLKSGERVE